MSFDSNYNKFLEIIFDHIASPSQTSLDIPLDDFTKEGISLNEVRRFFVAAKEQNLVDKNSIKYAPKNVTPSLLLRFQVNQNKIYCDPWYEINAHYKKLEKYITEIKNKPIKKYAKLYLDPHGNLWRKPKEKYCYPMGENSKRYETIKFLARTKIFQSTHSINQIIGGTNGANTRKEIGKIRERIKHYLNIEGDELIKSKKGSGYRINPQHEIILE